MSDEIIAAAVAGAGDTDVVEMGRGVLDRAGNVLAEHMCRARGHNLPALVVADERTWAVAGKAVNAGLRSAGVAACDPLVFPAEPCLYASLDNAHTIADRLRTLDAETGSPVVPIAVGSGTVNDLTKLAAKDLGRRYAVVGTAASMDGYTGAGAPISDNGVKVTMQCVAPQVVIFDLDITAAAPQVMTASGYGDLAAKIPGGADWIIADAAGVEPLNQHVWTLVQSGVRDALPCPDDLRRGDPDAFSGLVEGLILSGLAMQVYDGTRPASGAEHYFSHIWELAHVGTDRNPPLSHGHKVAIGTLAMLAFYEKFLDRDLSRLDIDAAVAAWPDWRTVESDIRSTFEGALADHAVMETKVKYVDADGLRARLNRVVDRWHETRAALEKQLVRARVFADQLRRAGAPSRPEDIGLTAADVRATFPKAMYYRSRYTVLDLAREARWYEELVEEVFAPDGLWT
ncbi:sn-glycerol-1-phosphate dehydrogenase [Cutibacterium namnetense]|nr:sn-glycerol-1-phosphate dehydrogenase [Cutibacterium namnetense]